jgi:putative restriction endonuclease
LIQLNNKKHWLEKMATLRVDPARGVAPHKPLLLLVVCDLAEEGKLRGSILHRDGDLAFRFSSYWTIVANRRRTKPDVRLPFYHLKTSGVWRLFDAAGNQAARGNYYSVSRKPCVFA